MRISSFIPIRKQKKCHLISSRTTNISKSAAHRKGWSHISNVHNLPHRKCKQLWDFAASMMFHYHNIKCAHNWLFMHKRHTTTLIFATLFSLVLISFSIMGNPATASVSGCAFCCRWVGASKSLSNAPLGAGMKGDCSNGSEITCYTENKATIIEQQLPLDNK